MLYAFLLPTLLPNEHYLFLLIIPAVWLFVISTLVFSVTCDFHATTLYKIPFFHRLVICPLFALFSTSLGVFVTDWFSFGLITERNSFIFVPDFHLAITVTFPSHFFLLLLFVYFIHFNTASCEPVCLPIFPCLLRSSLPSCTISPQLAYSRPSPVYRFTTLQYFFLSRLLTCPPACLPSLRICLPPFHLA